MLPVHDFDEAVQKIQARQHAARRRALLTVLLPAVLGATFLAYGAWQLRNAARETATLHQQAGQYRKQVASLNAEVVERTQTIKAQQQQLQSLQTQLQETTHLARFVHAIDFVDQKSIYSLAPRVAPVLGTILELRERKVSWHLGGTKPEQGFDSPSFAAYVLQRHGALPGSSGDTGLLARSRQLYQSLPKDESPQPGDLVFYPAGYALFWFVDQHHQPFVIGMTPSGIVALEPDFAPRIGIARPPYR